jgi:curved DNA-binding protein CbpA
MSYWEILGIEPTGDERVIKRAYAKQLKMTRPEDDPERFQALRNAYEYALDSANQDDFDDELGFAAAPEAVPATSADASTDTQPDIPRPDYSTNRQFIRVQPADAIVQPQRPEALARSLWQEFVDKCSKLSTSESEYGSFASEKAKEELTAVLKMETLESLELRELFKNQAIAYCADEAGLPLVRMTCLEVLKWEEERKLINFHQNYLARHAIDRAIADKQYGYLLSEISRSGAMKKLLEPGEPKIRWHEFYKESFAYDIKYCISRIRNTMPEVEYYRLGREKIAIWLDAADRPWPSVLGFVLAFMVGLIFSVMASGIINEGYYLVWMGSTFRTIVLSILYLTLLVFPVIATAAYPRYVHRPLQILTSRIVTNPRVHLGWWIACVVITSLAFSLPFLPSPFQKIFIGMMGILAVGDLYLKSQFNLGYVVFVAMMAGLVAFALSEALSPFIGAEAVFMPVLVSALFVSPRLTMLSMYGRDWYTIRPRAILLGIGILLAFIEYWMAPRLPILAALAGWWWVLVAVSAADIFFMSLARNDNQGGALIWLILIALVFYLPRLIPIQSRISGMLYLQLTIAISIAIGMLQNGWIYLKTRKKS